LSVQKNKEFILKPLVKREKLDDFLSKVSNVSLVYGDPTVITDKKFKTIFHSDNADLVVCNSLDLLKKNKEILDKSVGYTKKITNNEDRRILFLLLNMEQISLLLKLLIGR